MTTDTTSPPESSARAALWPPSAPQPFTRAIAAGALGSGVFAGVTVDENPSLAWLLAGVAALGLAGLWRRSRESAPWVVMGALLLVVPAVRDSGWLSAAAVLVAVWCASMAFTADRSWTATVLAPLLPVIAAERTARWVQSGRASLRVGRRRELKRVGAVAITTVVLVVVFGALFAGADTRFADLIATLVPEVRVQLSLAGPTVAVLVAAWALTGAYLRAHPPRLDALAPAARQPKLWWDWAVPVLALDMVFAAFVVLQAPALFGGREHVRDVDGPTYAEYARSGFWQLLIVTVAVLGVIAVMVRRVDRTSRRDRLVARVALGTLCALTMVVVASAIHRMALYESAFGFTRLRVTVMAVELWLGAVIAVVMIAGVALRARWLPRAVAAAAVIGVCAVAWVNPDAYVAERSVDRFRDTGLIDVDYLSTLSADAVPALDTLPATERACVLGRMDVAEPGSWWSYNVSRATARDAVESVRAQRC